MRAFSLVLLLAHPLLSYSAAITGPEPRDSQTNISVVCQDIQSQVSSASQVFYPGSPEYLEGNSHYSVSSSQTSVCSVEPGTAADVAKIIQIVGSNQTPFGVKCGGHSINVGFSSTTGVQIYMSRFNDIEYDSTTGIATVGGGTMWDDLYATLLPYGVVVPGGRVDGLGVAGFVLGGGFSWKTNQLGLAMDLIIEYELVKPNGQVTLVNSSSDPDLFFALKGGLNNFGIVTHFKFQTVPQGSVWGGHSTYSGKQNIDALQAAMGQFLSTVTDPKAVVDIEYGSSAGQETADLFLFYDAPAPPAGMFDAILAISTSSQDVLSRSYLSLVASPHAQATAGSRTAFQTLATTGYNEAFVDAVREEVSYVTSTLANKSVTIAYAIEPFLPTIFNNRTPTAYPPPNTQTVCPFAAQWIYDDEEYDDEFQTGIQASVARLRAIAAQQGLLGGSDADAAMVYPNYANKATPLESMYGENLDRLREIRQRVDPNNVMYLTGGFKF